MLPRRYPTVQAAYTRVLHIAQLESTTRKQLASSGSPMSLLPMQRFILFSRPRRILVQTLRCLWTVCRHLSLGTRFDIRLSFEYHTYWSPAGKNARSGSARVPSQNVGTGCQEAEVPCSGPRPLGDA